MESGTEQTNNRRIAKNTGVLYLRMAFQLIIGLYTSRIILQVLGFSDYGVYNVVGGVISMFGFLNGSMGVATNRFLTYELGKSNDKEKMHQVFFTALFIHLIICLLVLILGETIGLWYINNKLVVPSGREFAVHITYQCSIIASLIAIISVPYNAVIVTHEKMGAFAFITTLEVVVNLLIVISLRYFHYDRLILYAILIMFLKLLIRMIYGVYCNRHFAEVHGKFTFDKMLFKRMAAFAIWIMNGSLAVVCYTQGLNLLLNLFFGPIVNAARGVAVQVESKIMGFSSNFQMAIKPQITKQYAAGNYKYMHTLLINATKYSILLMSFFTIPIIMECGFILRVWLGKVPEYTEQFVILTLCIGIVESMRNPINTCIHATGKIKRFQIIEGSVSLAILPVAYLGLQLGMGPTSVFFCQLFFFVLLQIIRVFIICPAIYMKKSFYFSSIILQSLKVILPTLIISLIVKNMMPSDSFIGFSITVIVSCISMTLLTYFFVLDTKQKRELRIWCNNKIRHNHIK